MNLITLGTADREPDANYMDKGMIKRLTYPTGGYTEFDFEPHEFRVLGTNYTIINQNRGASTHPLYQPTQNSSSFSPSDDVLATLKYHIKIPNSGSAHTYRVTLRNLTQNTIVHQTVYYAVGTVEQQTLQVSLKKTDLYQLEAEATSINDVDQADYGPALASINLVWEEPDFSQINNNRMSGGLRIRSIKSYDENAQIAGEKNYIYTEEGDPTSSSGRYNALGYPSPDSYLKNSRTKIAITNSGPCYSAFIDNLTLSENANKNMGDIGYQTVTVIHGDKNSSPIGKTIYEYDWSLDKIYPKFDGPYIINSSWKRGQLKKVQNFNQQNQLVQSTENIYEEIIPHTIPILWVGSLYNGLVCPCDPINISTNPLGCGQPYMLSAEYYRYIPTATYPVYDIGWKRLLQTTETLNGVVTTTDYAYGNNHTQPIEVSITNSDGTKHITKTKYAADYTIDTNNWLTNPDPNGKGIAKLLVDHQILNPIEITQLIEKSGQSPKVVSANLFTYNVSNGYSLMHEIHTLKMNTPLEEDPTNTAKFNPSYIDANNAFINDADYLLKGTIKDYDLHGNLLAYQKRDDITTSFVWNDDQRPIAKVINAEASETNFTSFEDDPNATNTESKTGTKSLYVTGQYTFASPIPTTGNSSNEYTVSYWRKQGTNNWEYIEESFTYVLGVQTGQTQQTINGYIDEFRIYPKDALMTTLTYDENTLQVNSMTDENNTTAYFEYDDFQRLHLVRDFEGNILSENEYNYQDPTNASNNHNFVKTTAATQAEQTSLANLADLDKIINVQYLDGLGRPNQTVAVRQSPQQEDIVQHIEYDEFGQTVKKFLPFPTTSNNGAFRSNAQTLQEQYYYGKYGATTQAYSEVDFEASPLNRPLEQSAPGAHWKLGSGHTTRSNFGTNDLDEVRDFANDRFFDPNTLQKSGVVNENGVSAWTYTDKLGRSILSKQEIQEIVGNQLTVTYAETYTIYDDFGRVIKVIPPTATDILKNNGWSFTSSVEAIIYQYRYDDRGRLVEKKIPGSAAQIMLYDPLDRVILTQDGNLRQNNQWQFTKYDVLSRPILTGIMDWTTTVTEPTPIFGGTGTVGNTDIGSSTSDPSSVFYACDLHETTTNISSYGYTSNAFPKQYFDVHSVTWYDDHDFDDDGTLDAAHAFQPDGTLHPLTATASTRIKGKIAGTKVLVMDGSTTSTWLYTITHYDDRNRVIQIKGDNHLGGEDITTTKYDFTGKALQTKRQHRATGQTPITITNAFHYDHSARLTRTDHTINYNGEEKTIILSANDYDNLGQMIEKKLHSTNGGSNYLQNVDYRYNIRGWLTDINSIDFGSLSPEEVAAELTQGMVQKIKDSDISLELNVTELNAGMYKEVEISEKADYERLTTTTQKDESEVLKLDQNALQSTLTDLIQIDYTGEEVREDNYEQRFETLRNDLYTQMQSLGITNLEAQELIEEEVMEYYKNEWGQTVANDNNTDLFALHLDYTNFDNALNPDATAQFNGNISAMSWRVRGRDKQKYSFAYDDLSRLKSAKYTQIDDSYALFNQGDYDVTNINYDLVGNIETLNRQGYNGSGFGAIDQLTYAYQGNQLHTVAEASTISHGFKATLSTATNYEYDDNGNMTTDPYKNITIQYNTQNLPTRIDFTGTSKYIIILYDAAGVKLTKEVYDGTLVYKKHYVGGIEYTDDGTTMTLEAIYHEEGRLVNDGGRLEYEYTLKDHLGNARVSFKDVGGDGVLDETDIIQENHYYPFGMGMEGLQTPQIGIENKHSYNGKEMNDDFGLDWLDYGARWYDASLGRWSAVDPLSEKYYTMSPYNYVANNPLKFIDPDGKRIKGVKYDKKTGKIKKYTKWAIKNGTKDLVEARMKTEGGTTSIKQILESRKTYKLLSTDKVILHKIPNNKWSMTGGLTKRSKKTILATSNLATPHNVTDDELANAVTLGKEGFVDNVSITKNDLVIPKDPENLNKGEKRYYEAYVDSGIKNLDDNYSYRTNEDALHGNSAHEIYHLLYKDVDEADVYIEEKKSMEAEAKARIDYIFEIYGETIKKDE